MARPGKARIVARPSAAGPGLAGQGKAGIVAEKQSIAKEDRMTEGFSRLHVFGPGGHTTGPDVRAIMERWPALKSGDTIRYDEIAVIIHVDRASSRYKTVTSAWRRTMYREYNITIGTVPKTGFVVLDDHERVNLASSKMKCGIRRIRHGGDLAQRTDKSSLTATELKACDHLVRVRAMLLDAHATEARKLRIELREIR